MKLVGCGDSWMWGCELVDPIIDPISIEEQYNTNNKPQEVFNRHYVPENVAYRNKHRYQNLIANYFNFENVDLSKSGVSNNFIARTLLNFLADNDYLSGEDTSELLVIIGWTSPFRTNFYTDNELACFDLLPNFKNYVTDKELYNFYEYYTKHFWSDNEVLLQYASTVYQTECILKTLKIKYQMHQGFFDNSHYVKLEDNEIKNKLFGNIPDKTLKLWNSIDSKYFLNKNKSMYTYLLDTKETNIMLGSHPSVKGHKIISDYLIDHLKEHVL